MPTINSSNLRKPTHSKTFGIEIECIVPREVDPRYRHHGFFYGGSDGSISAGFSTGVEFVSQPLPFEWLCREISRLGKKFSWKYNDSCGIHVHVNRAWISVPRLEEFAKKLERISLTEFETLFGRFPNEYCNNRYNSTRRYQAINFTNRGTVEFRMFRSGDAEWAKECLRRTKIMCEFKGAPTFENLLEAFTRPDEGKLGKKG